MYRIGSIRLVWKEMAFILFKLDAASTTIRSVAKTIGIPFRSTSASELLISLSSVLVFSV